MDGDGFILSRNEEVSDIQLRALAFSFFHNFLSTHFAKLFINFFPNSDLQKALSMGESLDPENKDMNHENSTDVVSRGAKPFSSVLVENLDTVTHLDRNLI